MKPSPLGSVFASPSELAEMDKHSQNEAQSAEQKADSINQHLRKEFEKGEIRYYLAPNIFKTVRGNYFKINSDGTEQSISAPK